MMATLNSPPLLTLVRQMFIVLAFTLVAVAQADEAQQKIFEARARTEFQRALNRYQSDSQNATNVWEFAAAVFDVAEYSTNSTERAAFANQGIAASRSLVARNPDLAAGHFYLAMNLGQLARTRLIGALGLVKEMEREFKAAGDLDPEFDHAGPERNLGLLYRDAPGWPVSIGNPSKSLSMLRQSVKLAPQYPGNRLHLIESYIHWKELDSARRELRALDAIWPTARINLTGEKWEPSWVEWTTRRAAARKLLEPDAGSD